jgi:hypothetical protein
MVGGVIAKDMPALVQKPFELVDALLKNVVVKPREPSILNPDLRQDLDGATALDHFCDCLPLHAR